MNEALARAAMPSVDVLTTAQSALAGSSGKTRAQMEAAAKDFESVFMAQMLKPMWAGVETDSEFGGGPGEDVMRDLLIQEYGKSMARADNYGLSNSIVNAMIQMQQTSSGAAHSAV